MNRARRTPIVILLAGFLLVGAALTASMMARPAGAHGSTQVPASRVYTCRFENPNNPMCAAAWSSNSQALYDWMEVNIGDAAGRHRELILDGQLCSAGREKYAAFDRPGEWPVTALRADGSGLVDLVYQNTAPHSTEYYRVYITRDGFDARTDPLAWADLELAHDSGRLDPAPQNRMRVALPNRDVPAILYVVWQRSDSPEAFYACSDVTVSSGATKPPTSTASTLGASTPGTSTPGTSTPATSTPSIPVTTAASPTTAPPTTAALAATALTTGPPTTSSGQTSAAGSKASALTATTPPTSIAAAPPVTEDDGERSAGGTAARSTTPSSPGATTGDADLATRAASSTNSGIAGDSGGPLLLSMVGIGSAGLVLLGVGVRWSDQLHRVLAALGSRPTRRHHDVRHAGGRS